MRERSSRKHRSPSRERGYDRRREKESKSRKYKKAKKSKKHSRRSSSSSTSSYDSRESDYHSSSRRSRTRAPSLESNSRPSKTFPTSSENSRTSVAPPKVIDLTDEQVKEALATIEEDKFQAKSFYSTRDREAPKKTEKVVIDLNKETIHTTKPIEIAEMTKEQIFHPNFLGDSELKIEKWVRKLYNFRKKH